MYYSNQAVNSDQGRPEVIKYIAGQRKISYFETLAMVVFMTRDRNIRFSFKLKNILTVN